MEQVMVKRDFGVSIEELAKNIQIIVDDLNIEEYVIKPIYFDGNPSFRLMAYNVMFNSIKDAMAFKLRWI